MSASRFGGECRKWSPDVDSKHYSLGSPAVRAATDESNFVGTDMFSVPNQQPSLQPHSVGSASETWTSYDNSNGTSAEQLTTGLLEDYASLGKFPHRPADDTLATSKVGLAELASPKLFTTNGSGTLGSYFSPVVGDWSNESEKVYGVPEKLYQASDPTFDSEFEAAFGAVLSSNAELNSNPDTDGSQTCRSSTSESQSDPQHVDLKMPEAQMVGEHAVSNDPEIDAAHSTVFQKRNQSYRNIVEAKEPLNTTVSDTYAQTGLTGLDSSTAKAHPEREANVNTELVLHGFPKTRQAPPETWSLQMAVGPYNKFDVISPQPLMSNLSSGLSQVAPSCSSALYSALPGQAQFLVNYTEEAQMQLVPDLLSPTDQPTLPTLGSSSSLPAIRSIFGDHLGLYGLRNPLQPGDLYTSLFYPQEKGSANTSAYPLPIAGQWHNAHTGSSANSNGQIRPMVGLPQSVGILGYRHISPLQNYHSCSCGFPSDETMIRCAGLMCATPGFFHRRCAESISMKHDGMSWFCIFCRNQQRQSSRVTYQDLNALPWSSTGDSKGLVEENRSNHGHDLTSTSLSLVPSCDGGNLSSNLKREESRVIEHPSASSSLIVRLKTGNAVDGNSGFQMGRMLASLTRSRSSRRAAKVAILQIRDCDEENGGSYYSSKMHSLSAPQHRAELPPRRATAWTEWEEQKCIELMIKIKTSGKIKRIDALWEAVSQRLYEDYKIERTPGGVKNAWNRNLRAKSGFDERLNPQPHRMRTGLLPKLGSGLGWWTHHQKQTSACSPSTVGARKRSHYIEGIHSPADIGSPGKRTSKRRRIGHNYKYARDDDSKDEDWIA